MTRGGRTSDLLRVLFSFGTKLPNLTKRRQDGACYLVLCRPPGENPYFCFGPAKRKPRASRRTFPKQNVTPISGMHIYVGSCIFMYVVRGLQTDLCDCGQQSVTHIQALICQIVFLDQFFEESPTHSAFFLNRRIAENHPVEDRHCAGKSRKVNVIEQVGSLLTSLPDYLLSSRPSYFYPNLSYSCYTGITVRICK